MQLTNYIPFVRENAIRREQLVQATGLSDRKVRLLIQHARDAGELILNDQSGGGYYRAAEGDLEDIARQYRQDTARAMSILRRRKRARSILRAAGYKV